MKKSNVKRYVEFKGEHPMFEDGKCYSYAEYSKGTGVDGGRPVSRDTIKSRLQHEQFCTPDHLKSYRGFKFKEGHNYNSKEHREHRLRASRLESKNERLMAKWLKVAL
jgi:hypothetical protein